MTVKDLMNILEKVDPQANVFIRLNYNIPMNINNTAPIELIQVESFKHYNKSKRLEIVCKPNVLMPAKVDHLGRSLILDIPGCQHCVDEN